MADGFQTFRREAAVHRFTLGDVLRMQELGVLQGESRELIAGVIYDMASEGELHFNYKIALNRFFVLNAPTSLRVAPDATLMLSDYDAPEPDLFLFDAGARTHPIELDRLHLVIEIADTSLEKDTKFKPGLYARYGVPEYWVVDVKGRTTLVFRDPETGGYPEPIAVPFTAPLTPLRLPELSLRIAELP